MQEEITMSSFSIFLRRGFHFFNSFDLEFCIFSFCLNLRISNLVSWLGDGKLAVDVGCRLSGSGLNGQRHPECICIQKAMLCKDKSRAASFYSCETHWNEFVFGIMGFWTPERLSHLLQHTYMHNLPYMPCY